MAGSRRSRGAGTRRRRFALLASVLAAALASALGVPALAEDTQLPPGTITTMVGGGVGDGGPGREAPLAHPYDVALDDHGNLYIAEYTGARIRKVDTSTGVITTVAGTGFPGSSGDGGPAVNARITPANVAVDADGNVYFGEGLPFCVVRKVDAESGIVSTIAGPGPTPCAAPSGDGGPAAEGSIRNITMAGIAVGPDGSVYVSDFLDQTVRRIDPSGTITTVAGQSETKAGNGCSFSPPENLPATEARLCNPMGLAVDDVGNVYIGDLNAIWRVDTAGMLTRVAGGGIACPGGGPATNNCRGPEGQPAIGAALSSDIRGLAVDRAGNIYAADMTPESVRKVTPAGKLFTVAGCCRDQGKRKPDGPYLDDEKPAVEAELIGVTGVAVDAHGNVYTASHWNHLVHRVDTAGRIHVVAGNNTGHHYGQRVSAGETGLGWPSGMAQDEEGNVYVAEASTGVIRKIDADTGWVTIVAGNPRWMFCGQGPGCPAEIGDGGAANEAHLDLKIDANGQVSAVDAVGDLYIADTGHCRIRRVDVATGIISTVAGTGQRAHHPEHGPHTEPCDDGGDGGPATQAQLAAPRSVAVDPAGNLYITQYETDRNSVRSEPTNAASVLTGAHFFDCRVRRVDAATRIITTVVDGTGKCGYGGDGGPAELALVNALAGLALDVDGNLYLAERSPNCTVRKIDAMTGIITTVAGAGPAPLELEQSVLRFQGACGHSGDSGPATQSRLSNPESIALDSDGNLYIAEGQLSFRVRRVDAGTGVISTVAGTGRILPFGRNPDDTRGSSVVAGDYAGDGGPAISAGLSFPRGVLINSDGDLLIADAAAGRIRKVVAP